MIEEDFKLGYQAEPKIPVRRRILTDKQWRKLNSKKKSVYKELKQLNQVT